LGVCPPIIPADFSKRRATPRALLRAIIEPFTDARWTTGFGCKIPLVGIWQPHVHVAELKSNISLCSMALAVCWETNMSIHHLRFNDLKGVQRGQDIVNYPVVHSKLGALNLKSGITRIPVGAVVSRHYHDSEEQVTVLEGRLRLKLGDQIVECGPYDSTFITAGVPHEFTAIGDKPAVCMVIYGGSNTKRTFTETGETVEIGSERDRFPPPPKAV
jgi:quercetin dioxygenase-like cupin family protein